MIVTGSIKKAREMCRSRQIKGKAVGFVPTMGSLHRGHLTLVKKAKQESDFVVVSIFVNPTQFGPGEDYQNYPRNFSKDKKLLEKEGVDLLFYPKVEVIYSRASSVYVDESILSGLLCGKSRPGHFRGVCSILTKLFNIIGPDIVYLGRKDYQQAQIVKKLVAELNFPIKVRVLPLIREKDNLAMSSRNIRLTDRGRRDSYCLHEALNLAKKLIKEGKKDAQEIINRMKQVVKLKKSAKIDYIEIVDAQSLKKLKKIKGNILIALAVYIEKVRLIDNIILNVKN